MKKVLVSLSALALLCCTSCRQKPIRPYAFVQVKKVSNDFGNRTQSGDDDWTYWYIIPSNNDTGYYYFKCNCSTVIRDFSTVDFRYSTTLPLDMDTGKSLSVIEYTVSVEEFSRDTYKLFEQHEPEAATTSDGIPVDKNLHESTPSKKKNDPDDDAVDIMIMQQSIPQTMPD